MEYVRGQNMVDKEKERWSMLVFNMVDYGRLEEVC